MEVDIKLILKSIRDFWWLILIVALVFAIGIGAYANYAIDEKYESQFSLIIINRNNNDFTQSSVVDANSVLGEIHSRISKGDEAIDAVKDYMINNLGYEKISASAIKSAMQVSPDSTGVMTYVITTKDPEISYDIAKAAEAVIPGILTNGYYKFAVEELTHPTKPIYPSSPNVEMYAIIGFVIGAFLTWIIVFIKLIATMSIITKRDLTSRFSYPVIGEVPRW